MIITLVCIHVRSFDQGTTTTLTEAAGLLDTLLGDPSDFALYN